MAVNTNISLGKSFYLKKDFPKALFHLKQASRAEPRNVTVLIATANCYLQLRDYGNAISVIEQVLKIDTKNDKLYFHLSSTYLQIGNIENTVKACERALEINPRELAYYFRLADSYERIGEHDKALDIVCQGLKQFPDADSLQILAAKAERRLGKNNESLKRLNKLSSGESNLPPDWQAQYHFELGFIHDTEKNSDSAFNHFTKANDIIRSLPQYQRVDVNHSLNLIRNLGKLDFSNIEKIIEISRHSPAQIQPVFFVGFPRSGTTLLQKILDSHQEINVIEENNPLGAVTSLIVSNPEKYLNSSFLLNENNIKELRDMYFDEAKKHVPIDGSSVIIDKLPMNIVQVHIIKILFPDAKLLLGLRHPCDSILSCFMQNFAVNRAMASMFEFKSIIKYYDETMGLWHLFNQEIDFDSHQIRYEDLIENMEEEVRNLMKFLELPWDEEVLNYRQNTFKRGFINTPSYSQVIKPIYKEARYRWVRYAKYFESYSEQLKPHCDAFGYSLEVDDPK